MSKLTANENKVAYTHTHTHTHTQSHTLYKRGIREYLFTRMDDSFAWDTVGVVALHEPPQLKLFVAVASYWIVVARHPYIAI